MADGVVVARGAVCELGQMEGRDLQRSWCARAERLPTIGAQVSYAFTGPAIPDRPNDPFQSNLFSRGALMAAEMDERIRERSAGKKTFRDAMIGLMTWSVRNRRAFRIEELPGILAEGTGVDTREVMEKWLRPLDR